MVQTFIPKTKNGGLDSCNMYNSSENNDTVKCNAWVYDTAYYKSSRAMEVSLNEDKGA